MKFKFVLGIFLMLLVAGMLTGMLNVPPVEAAPSVHNLDTGEEFATIQDAINDPDTENGHTILVDVGAMSPS